jgi:hypothetical protein
VQYEERPGRVKTVDRLERLTGVTLHQAANLMEPRAVEEVQRAACEKITHPKSVIESSKSP